MKKVNEFILGALVGSMVMGGCVNVFGSNGTKTIQAVYKNIKVVIDGKELKTDKEPFTYDGTTYLPVRAVAEAVAEAVGKDVKWDGATQTVILGEDSGETQQVSDTKIFNGMVYDVPTTWTEGSVIDETTKAYYPSNSLVMLLYQEGRELQYFEDEARQDLLLKTIGNSFTNYEILNKRLESNNGQIRLVAELKGTKTVGKNNASIEEIVVLPSNDGIIIATYYTLGSENESSKAQFEKMIKEAMCS